MRKETDEECLKRLDECTPQAEWREWYKLHPEQLQYAKRLI